MIVYTRTYPLITVSTKLRQGNIITGMCQSFFSQGTPWADTPLGRHPPGQTPPWADTPLPGRHPLPGRQPPGQTLPPADTPPCTDTPLGRHPLDRHPPGRHLLCAGIHTLLYSACWDTPPTPTATAEDSTHPTGMHSCLVM